MLLVVQMIVQFQAFAPQTIGAALAVGWAITQP